MPPRMPNPAQRTKIITKWSKFHRDKYSFRPTTFASDREVISTAVAKNSALKAVTVRRHLNRADDFDGSKMHVPKRLFHQDLLRLRGKWREAESVFEREIVDNAMAKEVADREDRMKSGNDEPLDGENPYSNGRDYQLGGDDQLRVILPHIMEMIKYTPPADVRRCVLELELHYSTLKELHRFLQRDLDGEETQEWRDKFGCTWTHVELFVRYVMGRAEMRRDIARRNERGILTTANVERVYAAPGCYRRSHSPIAHDPGFSTTFNPDASSYGPWRWYRSDFGLSPRRTREEVTVLEHGAKYADAPITFARDAMMTRKVRTGIHGGRIRPNRQQTSSSQEPTGLYTMDAVRRWFVVDCPGVPVDGAFNMTNLLQGRVDNACRAVTAAVFLSHGMRQDTAVTLVCGGKPGDAAPKALPESCAITLLATSLRGFWPDEKSMATKLSKALRAHHKLPATSGGGKGGKGWGGGKGGGGAVPDPITGVTVENESLLAAVRRASNHINAAGGDAVRVLLHEEGEVLTADAFAAGAESSGSGGDAGASAPALIVLGGPDGLSEETQASLSAKPLHCKPWRIPGPSLHAAACVTIINALVDAAAVQTGQTIATACAAAMERAAERTERPGGRSAASYSFAASTANPLGGRLEAPAEDKDKKAKKEKKEKKAKKGDDGAEVAAEAEVPKKEKKEKKDKKEKKRKQRDPSSDDDAPAQKKRRQS